MIQTNRYLKIGPDGKNCPCCFPAPRSKDRRKQWRSAKRKADRAAMKEAEAQMEDHWALMQEELDRYNQDDCYFYNQEHQIYYDEWLMDEHDRKLEEQYERDYYDDLYWKDDIGHFDDEYYLPAITSYPPGAIVSQEELLEHSWVWVSSRKFRSVYDRKLVGDLTISELKDYNVLKFNGYNDWFVFANEYDAKNWAMRNGQWWPSGVLSKRR